ncbi:MAG: 50S ribosomal protein L22 [Candidatus Omnitrophota bacterium]
MLAKAKAKYLRVSARKTKLVIDLIRGKRVDEANFILDNINKKAGLVIKKVLTSAFANANNDRQDKLLEKELYISGVWADEGPMLKRFRAATMGRATSIKHRTAHISLELDKVAAEAKKNEESRSK